MLAVITGWHDIDMCFWVQLSSQCEKYPWWCWLLFKTIWKGYTAHSSEGHQQCSISQVTFCQEWQMHLTCALEGSCFATNNKVPLAIILTVQKCPGALHIVQSWECIWSISQVFVLWVNTAQYVFWVHFLLWLAKMPIEKTLITVKNYQKAWCEVQQLEVHQK